jgi:DNA-directed RNA polymerase III subunit RPC2
LSHVPSTPIDFTAKSRFLCLMARRLLDGSRDPTLIDDKDYYGNKRIELAGQLISLMFEDLFKRFCTQIAKQADQSLTRYHQAKASNSGGNASTRRNNAKLEYPDCFVNFPSDIITRGMQSALSTGKTSQKNGLFYKQPY